MRQSLEPKLAALHAVLLLLADEQEQTATAQLAKSSILADYRRIIANLARTAEALFRLIGRDDLADRIPKVVRRSLRRRNEEPAPTPTTPPASEAGTASS